MVVNQACKGLQLMLKLDWEYLQLVHSKLTELELLVNFTRHVIIQSCCHVLIESFVGQMPEGNVLKSIQCVRVGFFAFASNSCPDVVVLAQDEGGAKGYLLHGGRLS